MDEQSKAALDLLVQNGYLEVVKGKYRPTKKLNEHQEKPVLGTTSFTNWEDAYVWFIQECEIPRKGESGTGDLYDLNRSTDDAAKRFRQMIEKEGIKYDILVKVTTAYYKTGTSRFKKKIGNYITEGLWRMDYEVMKGQTAEQQQQTLQKQADESKPFTRDRIG